METKETFFIIIPINFEQMALDELKEKLNYHYQGFDDFRPTLVKGGIEVELPIEIGFSLNHILKLPTRILMRVDSFKCRDFPKLFNKLKKIEWRKYLIGQTPKVDCTTRSSRVINSKRVKETVVSAIKKYYKANTPKKVSNEIFDEAHTIIFVRFENDLCTVSVDTSGDRLNIRGERKLIGEAPIRENLAACVLYSLKNKIQDTKNIIDPMCGAGTILIEANDFYHVNYNRPYSYQYFPIHDSSKTKKLSSLPQTLCHDLHGFDIDMKMVEIAKENVNDRAHIARRDASEVSESNLLNCGIIINPPYGQRIIPDNRLDRFYSQIIQALINTYSPKFIALIIPKALQMRKIIVPKGHALEEIIKFKNGGFNVRLISINKLS